MTGPPCEIVAQDRREPHGVARLWPWVVTVALLGVAPFGPFLNTGTFVNGPGSALRLPLVSHGGNVPALLSQDFMVFTEGQYRPLGYVILALVRGVVSADNTFFWHLWLVAFHVVNALLVFALARLFARSTFAAFVAAAVFAVHPMASLFANRMNAFHHVLAGTFYLGALLCYVRFVRRRRAGPCIPGLVLFACGLLTSEVLLGLPVFLLLYELLYERKGVLTTLKRVLPFAIVGSALGLLRLTLHPHPMFNVHPPLPAGTGWSTLHDFVCRTGLYLKGIAGGWGLEAPLSELARPVTTTGHGTFVLWSAVIIWTLVLTVHELRRRRWLGLGMLLGMVVAVVPFVSTAFDRSGDLVSWEALYLVLPGFAMMVGAIVDRGSRLRSRRVRTAVTCLAVALVTSYAVLLVSANVRLRSPGSYWRHVLKLIPGSETASVELGRACLAEGNDRAALTHLFSPVVKSRRESSLIMTRHYCEDNELSAAAVHFHNAFSVKVDGFHARNRLHKTGAQLAGAMGALDYAEHALATVLMSSPYDTDALRMLASVHSRKGYLRAALKHLKEARRLDPKDPETDRQIAQLKRRMRHPERFKTRTITPPSPDWLRYLTSRRRTPELITSLIRLGDRFPNDPVIQLEAALCLLETGELKRARRKLDVVIRSMPSHPYAWAKTRRTDEAAMWNDVGYLLYQQGELDQAVSCFRGILKVDPDSVEAHGRLALVLTALGEPALAVEHYRKALAGAPASPRTCRSLAAVLIALGRFAECIDVLSEGVKAVPADRSLQLQLAWVLATAPQEHLRDGPRAVRLAESACRPEGSRDIHGLHILAAAYAETGRFDKAVGAAREAAGLARSQGNHELLRISEERARLYQSRRPCRLKP